VGLISGGVICEYSCTYSFQTLCDRGVDATSDKNKYQVRLLEGKCDRCVGMTALLLSCADLSRNSGNLILLEELQWDYILITSTVFFLWLGTLVGNRDEQHQ